MTLKTEASDSLKEASPVSDSLKKASPVSKLVASVSFKMCQESVVEVVPDDDGRVEDV